jgi:hypothetical protein
LAIYPAREQTQSATKITNIELQKTDWEYTGVIELYKLDNEGMHTLSAQIIDFDSKIEIVFENPVELEHYHAMSIFIQ